MDKVLKNWRKVFNENDDRLDKGEVGGKLVLDTTTNAGAGAGRRVAPSSTTLSKP